MNIYVACQMEDSSPNLDIMIQLIINILYFSSIFAFAYYWVPTKVTRTIDTLIISFKGASDRILELDDIKEVRVLNTFSCSKTTKKKIFSILLNILLTHILL